MVTTILIFAVILFILVIVHEAGHFVAAKLMGIRVDEFGFGLPPRIIGKKFRETIYSLNWLPIGGFVKLYGEDEQHPEYVKSEKNRAFFSKKPWKRAIVLTAGVSMNLVLAWVVYTFLFTQGVQVMTERVRIEAISPNSPAEQVGLQVGDVIQEIISSDKTYSIKSPQDLVAATDAHLGEEITLAVDRNGELQKIAISPRKEAPKDEGAMGVTISNYEEKKYSIIQAPVLAFHQVVDMIKALVVGLGMLIGKALTFQNVGAEVTGPVGIGRLVGQAKQFGSNAVLELLAVLSVNLGVINIIPFPALDGGRLLFVIVEGLTGKKLNPRYEQYWHQAGMFILLFLLLLITINDVLKLGGGST
jgi:regulator of sigma E protease